MDSPFKVEISAGSVDAAHSSATGSGLAKQVANEPASFTITSKDIHGNNVTSGGASINARLQRVPAGEGDLDIAVQDNHDGTI